MTRRLLATYLIITAVVLAVLEIPLGLSHTHGEQQRLESAIERDSRSIASAVEREVELGGATPVATRTVQDYRERVGGRVVITDATGISLADSDGPSGRDFSTRAEIASALDGQIAIGTRISDTLATNLMYVAVPITVAGSVRGAIRITYPTSTLDARNRRYWNGLAALAVVVLAGVALVGWILARGVSRPVQRLRLVAGRIAHGDLSARASGAAAGRFDPPELRELADDFDDMAERLEELVRSQSMFVADASHQLRTPLTALRLRLENLAAEQSTGTSEVDEALHETDRLQQLVDGLLALARAAMAEPVLERVDVGAVAKDRVETWSALAEDRGVTLTMSAPTTPMAADFVRRGLEQVLDNLLANAVEVCGPGTTISVSVTQVPDGVMVGVDDDGPGMTDEQLARATDRFWRSPDATHQGSGLGLAIVAQLVRQSRGSLTLRRNAAGGLSVELALSAVPAR